MFSARNEVFYGEKLNEDELDSSMDEGKVNEKEDFWSISPEKDVVDLSSCDENEVVPFKVHQSVKNSESESDFSPSPIVRKPLQNTLRAFEGKFDEGETVIEHVEDFIPKKKKSHKKKSNNTNGKSKLKSSKKRTSKAKMMERNSNTDNNGNDGEQDKEQVVGNNNNNNNNNNMKKSKRKKKNNGKKKKKKRSVPKPPSPPKFEAPKHPIELSPSDNNVKNISGVKVSTLKKRNLSSKFDTVVVTTENSDDEDDEVNNDENENNSNDFSTESARKKKKRSGSFHYQKSYNSNSSFSGGLRSPLKPVSSCHFSRDEFKKCLIIREKGGIFKQTAYYMHLQNDENEPIQCILAATKSKKGKTPNYHIFDMTNADSSNTSFTKKSSNYIGKLRTNFGGSACTLYDTIEREHASIIFSKEHQGALARIKQDTDPRVMRVLVPNVNNNGHMKLKNGGQNLKEKLYSIVDIDRDGYIVPPTEAIEVNENDKFQILGNKSPTFVRGSYRLNFGGRVLLPSVKNFQLCEVNSCKIKKDVDITDLSDIMLQFGKVDANDFHLDFKGSVTPFQAFGIMLAQFNFSF